MRFYGHVMRFVGRRGVGEAKEIHYGGMKRRMRQYQERTMHTRLCVEIAPRGI